MDFIFNYHRWFRWDASLESPPGEAASLPGFTRAVAKKLESEITRMITDRSTKQFKGLMISYLPSALDEKAGPFQELRLLTLLNCLETMCQVSVEFCCMTQERMRKPLLSVSAYGVASNGP